MSRCAVAMLGSFAPKSSSTVTMTAWATSKVDSGPETVLWLFDPALIDVSANLGCEAGAVEDSNEPSSFPPLVEVMEFSNPFFPADGEARFFAMWKPAQSITVAARAAPINNTEPRRFMKVGGGVHCRFFLLALAMLLVGSL